MSKSMGYAIRRIDDRLQAMQLAKVGDGQWKLLTTQQGIEPAELARALGGKVDTSSAGLAWILHEELVTCAQTPLPRLKRRELVRAVEGWVARQDGGTPDDWTISWRTHALASGNDGALQVAMAYARNERLAEELEVASASDLKPSLMLPPSLIIDHFFRIAEPEHTSQSVWNLVFVGGTENVLVVANQDGLLLTRPLPGLIGDEEDGYLDRLATEIDRSVFFARQTAGGHNVDGIYVMGDNDLAAHLVDRLKGSVEVECSHWRLDTVLDGGEHDLTADDQLLAMAAVVGAGSPMFNLAPRVGRGLLGPVARRRLLVGAAAGAVAVVPLLIGGGEITKRVQERYLAGAEHRLAEATVKAERASEIYELQRQLNAREELLAQHQFARHDLAGIMQQLAVAAPASVRFRELNLVSQGNDLVLQLTALSTGRSVTAAQESFMAFQRAVVALERVRPIGEPRQLQIGEVDEDGGVHENVLFTMDCRLLTTEATEEG